MTLDELRAWLQGADAADDAGLRAVAQLTSRTRLIVEKFDKSDIVTPGVDGLMPVETVILDYENGRLVGSETIQGTEGETPCR